MKPANLTRPQARPQPQTPDLDHDADLEARIESAHRALLTAADWPSRAKRWGELRCLLLRRSPQSVHARDVGGPEPVRAIVNRVLWRLLIARETARVRDGQ
jgi:hypothetical protein